MKGCPAYGDITTCDTTSGGQGEDKTHIYESTEELRQGGQTYEVVQTD